MDDREDPRAASVRAPTRSSDARRPRVLIAGAGERDLDALCGAIERRGIEPIVMEGAIEAAVRSERPNVVLLVGDAARDDGARGIDDVRRAGQTPVVVATDPEPLDRRLAPFQYGASGILVRRGDPDEMAGELQHLLGENARRIAERASSAERAEGELDQLVGLGSRELRMSRTPIEGVSRRSVGLDSSERSAIALRVGKLERDGEPDRPSVPTWSSDDAPTVERKVDDVPSAVKTITPLPDWDEDLTTKRQESAEVARWRRLSASDRSLLRTPEMMAALDSEGAASPPREPDGDDATSSLEPGAASTSALETGGETTSRRKMPHVELERALAKAREERGDDWEALTVKAPIATPPPEACGDAVPAARAPSTPPGGAPRTPRPLPPPPSVRPRRLSPLGSIPAIEAATSEGRAQAPTDHDASPKGPRTPTGARGPRPAPRAPGAKSATGERISSSALLALSVPSRPPIEDRASTLRAQAMPRPRSSVLPALLGLAILLGAVGVLGVGRWLQICADERAHVSPLPVAPSATGHPSGAGPSVAGPAVVEPHPTSPPASDAVVQGPEPGTPEPTTEPPSAPDAPTGALQPPTPGPTEATASGDLAAARERSDALVRDARTLARTGDRDGARVMLEQAVQLDPDNPHAQVALARALLAAGQASDAIAPAERAVSLRRRRAEYHVVLGDARAATGDRTGAETAWRTALELEPDHADASARLGR